MGKLILYLLYVFLKKIFIDVQTHFLNNKLASTLSISKLLPSNALVGEAAPEPYMTTPRHHGTATLELI